MEITTRHRNETLTTIVSNGMLIFQYECQRTLAYFDPIEELEAVHSVHFFSRVKNT